MLTSQVKPIEEFPPVLCSGDRDTGEFTFIRVLDRGGQGIVCLYYSTKYSTEFAVKFDPLD